MVYPIALKCVGFGQYRPKYNRPSSELDAIFNEAEGYTQSRFGIASRGVANEDETSSYMAAEAVKEAIDNAGWGYDDFDVLIGACGVMEQPIPGTSALILNRLGLDKSGIYGLDINLTCLSFLSALDMASLAMKAGRFRRCVIVSSDITSCGLDYSQREASAIFGDGAAAVCIEAPPSQTLDDHTPAVLASNFVTLSQGIDLAHVKSGGTRMRIDNDLEAFRQGARFYMDPFAIFKLAARHMPPFLDTVLATAGLGLDDIDCVICHQASAPALQYMRHMLKTRTDRVVDIFKDHGNQIAASLPSALYVAQQQGRLTARSTALLIGTSAGVSMGAMVLRL